MTKRYVHNPTAAVMFAGGVMIPPGEGRDIDATFLPPEGGEEAPASDTPPPDPDANLRDLLAHPLKDLVPQLEGLSTETLDRMAALEAEHAKPRNTLLSAISVLKLERAKLAAEGGAKAAEGGGGDGAGSEGADPD